VTDLATAVRIQVLDAFTGPLKKLGLELRGVEDKAKKIGDSFDFAAKLSHASEAAGKFARAARNAVTAPANEFIEFEHQMSKVAAVGDLTGAGFERMKKQALDLGAATRYSATQAAEAQENLVSAGFSVNEIMKLTPVSLQLATAADLDLARSSEILSGTLKAFGKDATQAANVADVLASAAAVSAADVEFLAEVTAKAGPIAKQLGISLETVSAAGSLFAEAQIDAAIGGTALKTVLLRLSAPANDAKKAFTSLHIGGKQLKDMQAQLGKGDLPGVLATIGKSFDKLGLTAVQRVEKLKHIFGDEAAAQASVLVDAALNTDEKGFRGLEAAYKKVDGAAGKMAERMDNDTAGSIERLSSAWSGFLLEMGAKLAPTIVQLSESIQDVLGPAAEWVSRNPALAGQLGRMAILTAGAGTALHATLITLSTATSAFGLAKSAILGTRAAILFLTPSIVSAKLAAIAASPAFTALSGSLLGKIGLVGAAAAAGYGIGRLISNLFGLDDKIAEMIAWITGVDITHEKADKQGLDPSGVQVYADGTEIDGKTGKVLKVGTGPKEAAPKVVRDARAAGATSVDDINKHIGEEQKAKAAGSPSAPAAAAPASPARAPTPKGDGAAAATREQTTVLEQALRRNEGATRELLEEQRRQRRRPAGSTGGNTAGSGAY
jgi:TP901 family phage tail tape measure protein